MRIIHSCSGFFFFYFNVLKRIFNNCLKVYGYFQNINCTLQLITFYLTDIICLRSGAVLRREHPRTRKICINVVIFDGSLFTSVWRRWRKFGVCCNGLIAPIPLSLTNLRTSSSKHVNIWKWNVGNSKISDIISSKETVLPASLSVAFINSMIFFIVFNVAHYKIFSKIFQGLDTCG